MDRLLTPEQISELLGVKISTIYQWTHIGYIPHFKLGRFVRFREREVMQWIESKKVSGREFRRMSVDLS